MFPRNQISIELRVLFLEYLLQTEPPQVKNWTFKGLNDKIYT